MTKLCVVCSQKKTNCCTAKTNYKRNEIFKMLMANVWSGKNVLKIFHIWPNS